MPHRSYTIGFLAQAWTPYLMPQLNGIVEYISSHSNLTLRDLRYTTNPQTPEQLERGRPPWTGLVDGVITAEGVERDLKETAAWMARGGVPVINLGADIIDPRICAVYTDVKSIGQLAVAHLASRGIRRFADVGVILTPATRLRRDAFNAALSEAGFPTALSYDLNVPVLGLGDEAAVLRREKGLIRLLKSGTGPLGVLALNDSLGRAVCSVAAEIGLKVPDDVAVVGVGNSDIAWSQAPSLSSIRTPGEEIGFTAARTLHDVLRGRPAPRRPIEIPALEVIARQSTLGRAPRDTEFERAIEFIRRHACSGISVEQVMQTITMSRRLFEQTFTQRVGRSPGQEIQRLRQERAEDLLHKTDLSINRIAQMVGFADNAAFSKFFKKRTGKTPGEHRASQG